MIDPIPREPGFHRDAKGALKRQASRFRVYGLNAAGVPIAELTADDATIEWAVHLANKKSSWYEFQLAQVDEQDVDLTGIEKVQRFPHGLRRD